MAQEWNPNVTGAVVTMDAASRQGTIVGPGRTPGKGRYQASAYWGLIEYGSSYRIVQLYYKLKPEAYTTYRQLTECNDKSQPAMLVHGDCVSGAYENPYARSYSTFGVMAMYCDGDRPLTTLAGLSCKNRILYRPTHVRNSGHVVDGNAKYYKVYGRAGFYWQVFSSKFKTKTQSAASAWKNQAGKKETVSESESSSSIGIYSTALNPAAMAAMADAVFAAMQRTLDNSPEWRRERNFVPNRLPNGMPNFAALRDLVQETLSAKGWSQSQITAFLESKGVKINTSTTVRGGGNTGGGGGQSNPLNNPPKPPVAPTPAVTKVVVRAPYGFAKPATKAPDNRPQIVQNYTTYVKDSSADGGVKAVKGQDIFVFPYTPNNVSYSGLGSKWDSIDRQGNFPIVEWSSWDLMRCEMEFLVAEDRTEGATQVPDGLFVSVQDRLNTLRRMSQRQAAVTVFNLDDLFRVQVKRAKETGKALQFVIADLSFTSTRRSIDSVEKEITAASVKLTLQEIPIEKVSLVKMSPPAMSNPIVPKKPPSGDETPADPIFSDGFVPLGYGT